jgi:HK97 family phage portal protein
MGFLDFLTPTIRTAATPESVDVAAASVAPYYSETSNIFFSGIVSATRAEAMSVPTVARCLGVMQTIGSLPLHVRNIATGEKIQAPRVINQPDPRIPGVTFWSWIVSDLFFHPVAYAYVTDRYADTGKIRSMERIAPERVFVEVNPMVTEITGYRIDQEYVDPNNLVQFAGVTEGLLSRAGRTIKAAASLEKAAMNFADEPNPLMILKSTGATLPKDRVANLLTSFGNARRNKKSTAFLNADVSLEQAGFDPKAIQLNEARMYVSLELARACGLPAYFADAQPTTFTYSNALDKRRDLIDFAFRSTMSVIEQRLSFQDFISQGTECKFDIDDFLRGDPLQRAQVYKILNEIGAMSVEEIREEEDMLL